MTSTVRHYTRDDLALREDVEGARMWGVALKQTMLTYFEVEPHCTFEMHTHESEQITFVLEGVLIFQTAAEVLHVGPGEVIAIPSMVPHSVHTEEHGAKAVDAWSPVMDKYKEMQDPARTIRPTDSRAGNGAAPTFTDKQGQYLAFIHYYTVMYGRAPAEADLQRFFRTTPPAVHQMICKLEQRGLISRQPYVARSIRLLVDPEMLPRLRGRR